MKNSPSAMPRLIAASAMALALFATVPAPAAVYTYSGVSGNNNWSSGTDWDATPVSASDTTVLYEGTLTAGVTFTSNNDVADPFTLNKLDFNYAGPGSGTRPQITLTGGVLNFVNDGGTSPVIDLRPSGGATNSRPFYTIENDITATDDLTVFADAATFNGSLNTTSNLVLTGGASGNATWDLGASSSIAGDVTIMTNGTSGGTRTVALGGNDQIGGSVILSSNGEGAHVAQVQLNGFNETINGLSAIYEPNMRNQDGNHKIMNGGATDSVLTVGDNDTTASYMGQILDGGAGTLSLVKTGTGTQTLAARSTYTGTTTVEGGTLEIDFTQIGLSQTSDPSNYFSTTTDLTLNGGTTLAIKGLTNGDAVTDTVGTQQFANYITVSSTAIADQLVVGQELTVTRADTSVDTYFVTNISGTRIYTETRTGGGSATLTTSATVSSTSQTFQSLTLAGTIGTNHTLDFGSSGSVVMTIDAAPVQLNDGSFLTIANWSGVVGTGGGTERLMFVGSTTDFTSVFDQNEVIFDGFGAGYALIDGGGIYEVVAVPEPGSLALLFAGASLLILRRRR